MHYLKALGKESPAQEVAAAKGERDANEEVAQYRDNNNFQPLDWGNLLKPKELLVQQQPVDPTKVFRPITPPMTEEVFQRRQGTADGVQGEELVALIGTALIAGLT